MENREKCGIVDGTAAVQNGGRTEMLEYNQPREGLRNCTEDWMEREVILYIGVSVDGYLADADGGVDWMKGHGAEEGGRRLPGVLRDCGHADHGPRHLRAGENAAFAGQLAL